VQYNPNELSAAPKQTSQVYAKCFLERNELKNVVFTGVERMLRLVTGYGWRRKVKDTFV